MAEWTTPADVTGRWVSDEPIPADDAKLETLLTDAEDTALAAVPDIQERIAAGTLPLARVQKVIARVVIRHLNNPKGLRQAMDTTGPFSTQVMHSGDSPGEMYLTDADIAELAGSGSGKAYMINTVPPPVYGTGPQGWLNYGGSWYV